MTHSARPELLPLNFENGVLPTVLLFQPLYHEIGSFDGISVAPGSLE